MPDIDSNDIRIGVYVCYCGGNISEVINCERVAKALRGMPNVVVARTDMSMCSDAGQALIEGDIREKEVNRVVVGACAPSLHESTFRGTVQRAGLNPYLYYHVGLREQDSWVHHSHPQAATEKAIRLMAAGLAKARLLTPLDPILLQAERHALVIGAGMAGLRTTLDIAQRGIKVTLVEKTPFLGGRVAQLETVFPCGSVIRDNLHELIDQVVSHPNVRIYTQAEVMEVRGYVGEYQIQIWHHGRGVTNENAEAVMAACTQVVPDEFNYGLTQRKVVYQAYPGCYPSIPAVDWENYNREPIHYNGKSIILKDQPGPGPLDNGVIDLNVGAIVMATGFDPYEPRLGEYGYGEISEIVTLPKFIRYLAIHPDEKTLSWNGRPVRDVALIHCVGSREIEGVDPPHEDGQVNNYCSRVCCTAMLHLAVEMQERFPDIHIFDLYEDIRTYGRGHEEYYQKALEKGVRFLRFHGEDRPDVAAAQPGDTHPVLVTMRDHLTWGEEIEIPVDLVILAVGMVPRDIDALVKELKISRGVDRFLAEVHPKLRPVETAVPGIILAGTAQGPMNIQETVAAASAAASKVATLLAAGEVRLEPFVAKVDLDKCDGTGACVEVCQYEHAIAIDTIKLEGKIVHRAVVTPANCSGCGNCVSACPNQAIDVQGWTLTQYEAMVDALAMELPQWMEEAHA